MKINIKNELISKGYSWENIQAVIDAFPDATHDLILHSDEYQVVSVGDLIKLIHKCKLDLNGIITNDYNTKSQINEIISIINADLDVNIIKQNWDWENLKNKNIYNWPLILLEEISNKYKISLRYIINKLSERKNIT